MLQFAGAAKIGKGVIDQETSKYAAETSKTTYICPDSTENVICFVSVLNKKLFFSKEHEAFNTSSHGGAMLEFWWPHLDTSVGPLCQAHSVFCQLDEKAEEQLEHFWELQG